MDSPGSTTVVTFLFTDIEGSTEQWEQVPQRMAQAVALHDALIRNAVEAHRGRVIKTTGDGMYAAFLDAADCVAAVVVIQIALANPAATAGLPIVIRSGLHRGTTQLRDNDYFGNTVNRTARVMSAAHGGQVLVSRAVVDALRERPPPDVAFVDLGNVRLKGFATPEHVFQVLHPHLRQDFPALRSLEAIPNNLPHQISSFVGRESDLDEAAALLRRTRLLTLLGMGGLGKTRLALRLGADTLDDFPDGVWFVDLAPIQDPALVPAETARVLGLPEQQGARLEAALGRHLKSRTLLLILDNCEHVIGASANLASSLLLTAPKLRIIATSREALQVPGEQTYPVLPLAVPARTDELAALLRSPAVQLFVERARQHLSSFSLNERNAPDVAELVARLEGIPLAIELAAARVRSLTVADINARLNDRYKLLTGGGRLLLARQQTLRALVDWSYDLLPDNERTLLDRLGVFAGGFDLAAAEAACGAEPLAVGDTIDLLMSLVDKSLVMAEDGDLGIRYRLLETIRDYARMKLVERGELEAVSVQHSDYFYVKARAGRDGLEGPKQAEWMRQLELEHDNMRAAIAFALGGGGDPIIAVRFEVSLQAFRILRGYATEGRRNVRALLSLPAIQNARIAHAHALYVGACLASSQGDNKEAVRLLETCLGLRRGIGNQSDIAGTLSTLAAVRLRLGDPAKAREGELEALAAFRQLDHRVGEAIVLLHLGEITAYTSDDDEAGHYLDESLAIARALGHQELESDCEMALGGLALERADPHTARAHFERALAVCNGAGDKRGTAAALWRIGKADIVRGDLAGAQPRLNEALRSFQSFQMGAETIGCLEDHARLAQSLGSPERAASLMAAAAAAREDLMLPRAPREETRWQRECVELRELLRESAFDTAWSEGRNWDVGEAIRRALSVDDALDSRQIATVTRIASGRVENGRR